MAKKYKSAADEYSSGAGETPVGRKQRVKANRQVKAAPRSRAGKPESMAEEKAESPAKERRESAGTEKAEYPKAGKGRKMAGEAFVSPPPKSNDRPWEKSKARSRARRNRRC